MLRLRLSHFLLIALLYVQVAMLGHGIEHEFQQLHDKQLPTHSCVLCLSGQHVGDGLLRPPPAFAPVVSAYAPPAFVTLSLPYVALPEPRQGSPPLV